MLKWTLVALAFLAGIPAVLALVGVFLPVAHVAARTIVLAAPPSRVFAAITDVDAMPSWRPDVKSVQRQPDDGRGVLYRESGSSGDILFRQERVVPDALLVIRIADPKLPFGGTWTYELKPSGAGTELTITENGQVYNPFFRTMQRFFFSPYKTIDTYQANLKRYLER